jgi:hypothetical protein
MPAYGLVPDSPIFYYGKKFGKLGRTGGRGLGRSRGGAPTRFSFVTQNLVIYQPLLHAELNTRSGGLWKALEVAGTSAVAKAKAQAGVKTGKLRSSIHKRHMGNFTGQYLWIGSTVNYAYMHHEGTRPHLIVPRVAGKMLRFSSKGRMVMTPGPVMHPGTKPNPYLSNQLRHFRRI